MTYPNDVATAAEVIRGRVRVEWQEGVDEADYTTEEGTPAEECLRFYASVNLQPDGSEPVWWDIQDGSYDTLFPASATPAQRQAALELIMDRIWDRFEFRESVGTGEFNTVEGENQPDVAFLGHPDKELEVLSYIEPSWLDGGMPARFQALAGR